MNGGTNVTGAYHVLITSNQRLRLRLDGDHQAWRRRLLIVEFQKPASRVIPRLAQEIVMAEGSGILNVALAGLARVRTSFSENGEFPLKKGQRKRVEDLIDESDSLRSFLRAGIVSKTNGDVTTEDVYHAYEKYCADRSWVPQPPASFRHQLPQLMLEFFRAAVRHDVEREGTSRRGYVGVALRQEQCP
jgi:putative DNA primase/helicase